MLGSEQLGPSLVTRRGAPHTALRSFPPRSQAAGRWREVYVRPERGRPAISAVDGRRRQLPTAQQPAGAVGYPRPPCHRQARHAAQRSAERAYGPPRALSLPSPARVTCSGLLLPIVCRRRWAALATRTARGWCRSPSPSGGRTRRWGPSCAPAASAPTTPSSSSWASSSRQLSSRTSGKTPCTTRAQTGCADDVPRHLEPPHPVYDGTPSSCVASQA